MNNLSLKIMLLSFSLINISFSSSNFEGNEKVDCSYNHSSSIVKLKFIKYRHVDPNNPNIWSERVEECSGSLVDYKPETGKSYILTAFHCVHNGETNGYFSPSKTEIIVNSQCQGSSSIKFIGKKILIHPIQHQQITTFNLNFKPSLDYALIEVDENLSNYIQKMKIPKNHNAIKNIDVKKEYLSKTNQNDFYLKYNIAGFPYEAPFKPGVFFTYQSIRGLFSKDLQSIPLLFKIYQGMSGGPIYIKDSFNQFHQIGVNSVYYKVINLQNEESTFKRSEAALVTQEKLNSLVDINEFKLETLAFQD